MHVINAVQSYYVGDKTIHNQKWFRNGFSILKNIEMIKLLKKKKVKICIFKSIIDPMILKYY